jgi:hypothetical protein
MHKLLSPLRRPVAEALHARGVYAIGRNPFGAIDKPLNFRRYGISLVFDIGANHGDYAQHLRYLGFTGRIISVEPASEPFADMAARATADPLWEVHRLASRRPGRDGNPQHLV